MDPSVHFLTAWDRTTFVAINHNLRSPVLDFLMPRVSDLGLGHVQFLALLLVVGVRGRSAFTSAAGSMGAKVRAMFRSQKRWFLPMLLAFAISGLGATVIKQTVQRDRPHWFYTTNIIGRDLNVEVRTVPERPPMRVRGFLSGHTSTSVALVATATVLFWGRRRVAALVCLWALVAVISFSRIYLADHWPLDVIAGAGLGLLSSFAALRLSPRRTGNLVGDDAVKENVAPHVSPCVAGCG
jgi:membrane-associated phospholipid phosphatase